MNFSILNTSAMKLYNQDTDLKFKYIWLVADPTDDESRLAEIQCWVGDENIALSSNGGVAHYTTDDYLNQTTNGQSGYLSSRLNNGDNNDNALSNGTHKNALITLSEEQFYKDLQRIVVYTCKWDRTRTGEYDRIDYIRLLDATGSVIAQVDQSSDTFNTGMVNANYLGPSDSTFSSSLKNVTENGTHDTDYRNYNCSLTNPSESKLDVNGLINLKGNLDVIGDIHLTGTLTSDSDKRIKENIVRIEDAIQDIDTLKGYRYTRNDLNDKEKIHIGVIAQEIEEKYPELISENSSTGIKSVNYNGISAILIECVKSLKEDNKVLKEDNKALKEENKELKEKNNELENRMNTLYDKLEGIEKKLKTTKCPVVACGVTE